MANAEPVPPSLSVIRRRLLSATKPAAPSQSGSELGADSIDFENHGEDSALLQELQRIGRTGQSADYGDVDALLQRYEAEKGAGATGSSQRRAPLHDARPVASTGLSGELPRLRTPGGLPPLTTANNVELERLRAENSELKQMVTEYRQLVESNQVQDWEQKIQEAEQLLAEKDEQIDALQKQLGEWEEKLKTNRFVPSDDDLAQMADELDKERSQFSQERKQLDCERKQLKEDEESLMKQMREMEVGMAKDRAELARQRTELQRMQIEVRHELELLQRGDVTLKDRLAQFQRRAQDTSFRPPASQQPAAPTGPEASPPAQTTDRPRESGVFRRLFGQNG